MYVFIKSSPAIRDCKCFVVKEDTLQDMVNHMTERTGIVHQMPFTSDRNGFAATLEKVNEKTL